MKQLRKFSIIFCLCCSLGCSGVSNPPDISPNAVVPSLQQIAYQEMELIGFIHFSINTFTDKEWGYGDEPPQRFNPTALNPEQWAEVANQVGMKQLILTAKHHDGFCLWPSELTEHSVKNSPWQNGKGDVVGDFVKACRKFGLKVGLYLSPWDRNYPEYGNERYLVYYRKQLQELLTHYGEISEVWFDGANGGSGYYGGANEERRIDRTSYYGWPEIWAYVKSLQPNAVIFSDAGPDVRWIGNEHGHAGETHWSMINSQDIVVGQADTRVLNSGEPDGAHWVVGECDVSIRPGWFYHESQDDQVKSPEQLVDIYYKSVGRNGVLLLNLPPDQRGLIHENDIRSLVAFRAILDSTFKTDLARSKTAIASNYRLNHDKFAPGRMLDGDNNTYWATDDGVIESFVEIDLGIEQGFDRIMIQEPIRFGQRISEFSIEYDRNGTWTALALGTTIGHKRLIRTEPVQTSKVRLSIIAANNTPAISTFALYKAPESVNDP